jgi:hypothetical protein
MIRGAVLSSCNGYRYQLSREWGYGPKIGFIMLNPSTADAEIDDRTIVRCIGFGRHLDYGGILVGNLFGWRATDPNELKIAQDPIGPENDYHLKQIIDQSALLVCAWGVNGTLSNRNREVLSLIRSSQREPHCLARTKNGHPKHPLYVLSNTRPIPL